MIAAFLAAWGELWAGATFEVLEEFVRPGVSPAAGLVHHADGNFYGTTAEGGSFGCGTVFKVSSGGLLTTLVSFTGTTGAALGKAPVATLAIGLDGALYGTTSSGGTDDFGTVFKLTTAGVFTSLVSFTGTTGAAPGAVPEGLLAHSNGNFYGLAQAGGAGDFGCVFRVTSAGVLTNLVEFTGTTGARLGAEPVGNLVANGTTLYGVTKNGGTSGNGTVFSVTTAGTWTLLADLTGTAGTKPGSHPAAGVYRHTDSNLYGTTEFGGTNDFGTVFKITSTNVYSVLKHFADTDGSQPVGALVLGTSGTFYGTTAGGGADGFGTLYKITTGGTHTVLGQFTGEVGTTLGAVPQGGLAADTDGSLWGTTSAGGAGNLGVIFRLTTAGAFTRMAEFSGAVGWSPSGAPAWDTNGDWVLPLAEGGSLGGGTLRRGTTAGVFTTDSSFGGTSGAQPAGGLVKTVDGFFGATALGGNLGRGTIFKRSAAAAVTLNHSTTAAGATIEGPLTVGLDGNFYGVAREGGTSSKGTIFKMTPAGVRTRLVSFTGTAGAVKGEKPRGPLARGVDGNFYGVTELGGAANVGVVFKITPAGVYTLLSEFFATGVSPRRPQAGLVKGPDDEFYGTTADGGLGDFGTVVRIDATGTVTVLAELTGAAGSFPGAEPAGPVTFGPDGTLYGLATGGGTEGVGTIFRIKSDGWASALVEFTGNAGGIRGNAASPTSLTTPVAGGLAWNSTNGMLYGAVPNGGQSGGGTVFRILPPAPLEDWKMQHFGTTVVADNADADGDGMSNLLEYALGASPDFPGDLDVLPQPSLQNNNDGIRLALLVRRDPKCSDIVLQVQATSGLEGPWETLATSTNGAPFVGPGLITGDGAGSGPRDVLIQDTELSTTAPHRFMRLHVTH